jgi:hypothetical protein
MSLRSIDLNLLVIFDALMAENSITGAARKVGITPSSSSVFPARHLGHRGGCLDHCRCPVFLPSIPVRRLAEIRDELA